MAVVRGWRLSPRRESIVAVSTTLVLVAATAQPVFAAPGKTPGGSPVDPSRPQAALSSPDSALGGGWRDSTDRIVTGVGDSDGFHLYIADEKHAFAWSTLATLNASIHEAGVWTGYTCLTGTGRYAVAVYVPGLAANRPSVAMAGALAAVVDTKTGAARQVAAGVELAYFSPACGVDDRVLLTRSLGREGERSELLTVDAAAGRVTAVRAIDSQLTTPAPTRDGDYGVSRGKLVRISESGALTEVATPRGVPATISPAKDGSLDLLSIDGDQAVATRYNGGRLMEIGTAPKDRLELMRLGDGRNALVGDVAGVRASGVTNLTTIRSDKRPRAVSRQGHLLVDGLMATQTAESVRAGGAPVDQKAAGKIDISVQATSSGRKQRNTVITQLMTAADHDQRVPAAASTAKGFASSTAPMPLAASQDLTLDTPTCAIPRNDVRRQALQPSFNQVEWAVDQAVHGNLLITRYSHFGEAPFVPQELFKPVDGVQIPAQIMLGVLAQESNMAQASWHAVPGDGGNPLISDYYGSRPSGDSLDVIDYSKADCGYGIAQVTDGMRADSNARTPVQKVAIATDYTANIAAGLQILAAKWNQLKAQGTSVNGGDPQYIENWYLALWGYNTGVYAPNGSSPYGVGWYNNPANPRYNFNREAFLRSNPDDASHPNDWPYQERVLGWVEVPQWGWDINGVKFIKYSQPTFHSPDKLIQLPGKRAFCGGPSNNACNPNAPDSQNPCPVEDSTCWWHGTATWVDCTKLCATEALATAIGAAEPPLNRTYPLACSQFFTLYGTYVAIVDDLTDRSQNLFGCNPGAGWGETSGGKFTLRTGSPTGGDMTYYGQKDLHQFGAGYYGHSWFTHAYYPEELLVNPQEKIDPPRHKVVGTWTPDLPSAGNYEVVAHVMSHGANYMKSQYLIYRNDGQGTMDSCAIDQNRSAGADMWISLGIHPLTPGASVQLSNVINRDLFTEGQLPSGDGVIDIGFDALAFVKDPGSGTRTCGTQYLF